MICLPHQHGMQKKRDYVKYLVPVATKVHTATQIHSRPQAAKETLQEYIQRITNLVIHATAAAPTSVTCKVTTILFIRHLFNEEIMKQVAGTKNIQTLAMP